MSSKKLKQYIEADKMVKEAEAKKDEVKSYINKLLKRCRSLGVKVKGVTYVEQEKFDFNHDELYKWVSSQVDEKTLENITIVTKTIDYDKLNNLYLDGIIDTTKMPSNCYISKKYGVIRINHKEVK